MWKKKKCKRSWWGLLKWRRFRSSNMSTIQALFSSNCTKKSVQARKISTRNYLKGWKKCFTLRKFSQPHLILSVCVCVYLNYFSTFSSIFLPFLFHLYLISAEVTSLEMAKCPPPCPAPTFPAPPIRKTPLQIRDREGWDTHDPTLPHPIAIPNYFDNFYKLIWDLSKFVVVIWVIYKVVLVSGYYLLFAVTAWLLVLL